MSETKYPIQETLKLEMILCKNGVPHTIEEDGTTVISQNLVKDKRKLNEALAEVYNYQSLSDKSGFSDFLAKSYAGDIKNAN